MKAKAFDLSDFEWDVGNSNKVFRRNFSKKYILDLFNSNNPLIVDDLKSFKYKSKFYKPT